ncbi:MAG: hypothetical protein ACR2OD_09430 [Gaiellaceae bacterium]
MGTVRSVRLDVERNAADAGISPATLTRARKRLDVRGEKDKSASSGGWILSLPAASGPEDAQTNGHHPEHAKRHGETASG